MIESLLYSSRSSLISLDLNPGRLRFPRNLNLVTRTLERCCIWPVGPFTSPTVKGGGEGFEQYIPFLSQCTLLTHLTIINISAPTLFQILSILGSRKIVYLETVWSYYEIIDYEVLDQILQLSFFKPLHHHLSRSHQPISSEQDQDQEEEKEEEEKEEEEEREWKMLNCDRRLLNSFQLDHFLLILKLNRIKLSFIDKSAGGVEEEDEVLL